MKDEGKQSARRAIKSFLGASPAARGAVKDLQLALLRSKLLQLQRAKSQEINANLKSPMVDPVFPDF